MCYVTVYNTLVARFHFQHTYNQIDNCITMNINYGKYRTLHKNPNDRSILCKDFNHL